MMTPPRTLLIVPPFACVENPSLGLHILQSVARERGFEVDILYSNLIFAAMLGEDTYTAIIDTPFMEFLGERMMAWFAFDGAVALPDLTRFNQSVPTSRALDAVRLQQIMQAWVQQVLAHVARHAYQVIGVTSTFDQTNACLILLRACRKHWPDATLLIGGPNCEGEMADGMAAYLPEVDYIFSGDSEAKFCELLSNPAGFNEPKIVRCAPNDKVNQLPPNDFVQYREQLNQWLPDSIWCTQMEMPMESSRGCWWGQKHHCTFCGLNGEGMGFREKDAASVFAELMALQNEQQAAKVLMTDNIMPHSYFKTLLPMLAQANHKLDIFYEQKANIDLAKMILLKQAGIQRIQPGIESLHSGVLKLMRKGVTARQNLALLRYARAANISVAWNLLYGFPGEQEAWYAAMLKILPNIAHLHPPTGMRHINIDRFSPFFMSPAEHGLSNLRPCPVYASVYPGHPNLVQMAYHFLADPVVPTFADSALLAPMQALVEQWREGWRLPGAKKPELLILELKSGQYMMIDSRIFQAQPRVQMLTYAQAAACLVEQPTASADIDWALQQQAAIECEGAVLPLAVADPQVMLRFERACASADKAVSSARKTIALHVQGA